MASVGLKIGRRGNLAISVFGRDLSALDAALEAIGVPALGPRIGAVADGQLILEPAFDDRIAAKLRAELERAGVTVVDSVIEG